MCLEHCTIFYSIFSNAFDFFNFSFIISIRQSIASGISFILCNAVLLEFPILYSPDISPDRQWSLDSVIYLGCAAQHVSTRDHGLASRVLVLGLQLVTRVLECLTSKIATTQKWGNLCKICRVNVPCHSVQCVYVGVAGACVRSGFSCFEKF